MVAVIIVSALIVTALIIVANGYRNRNSSVQVFPAYEDFLQENCTIIFTQHFIIYYKSDEL